MQPEPLPPLRVGVLTQYYSKTLRGISRTASEHLALLGHRVRVLTTDPNWRELRGRTPRDSKGGPQVRWLATYTDRSKSGLKRMVNYLSYSVASSWARGFIAASDVTYVYATQMTAGVAADLNKYTHGTPFVLHVQDVWPDSVTGSGMAGSKRMSDLVGRVLDPWVSYMYRRADAVVAISPEMRELLIDRGSDPRKTFSVYNWARPGGPAKPSDPSARPESAVQERSGVTNLVYAGNMGPLQDLGVLIKAMSLLRPSTPVHLWMVGDGIAQEDLIAQAANLHLSNVTFAGRVAPDRMMPVLEAADFLVVTLKDLDIFRTNVPSKLQAALAAGKPVVTNVAGAVANVVGAAHAGFTSSPNSPEALAQAIEAACLTSTSERDEMGESARAFYDEHMARSVGLGQLEKILRDAASRRKPKKLRLRSR